MDPTCDKLRSISLFIEDRRKIWLALEDVNWAIQTLCAQYALRGVESVPANSTGPQLESEPHGEATASEADGETRN